MARKKSEITILEQENLGATTQIELTKNSTVRETSYQSPSRGKSFFSFRGYRIIKQMPSASTEADIFIIEKDGVKYVLKLYRYGIEPKRDILQAVKMLSNNHHDEFIYVYDADFDTESKRWFEIQEYVKFGSLQHLINQSDKFTPEQRSMLFTRTAYEVGKALNILHQENILHLDMKPSNILMRSMKPFNLVLIDFGIASTLSSDLSKKFTQTRGTPMYQSPESWVASMGRASDWWGLGMILLEIAAGKHPFHGLNANVIASIIATRPVEIPSTLDEGQRELIRGLLTRDPDNRWRWEQVMRWLRGERGICDKFEEVMPQSEETDIRACIKPLKFMGKECFSLEEFSRYVVQSEEEWDKGKVFLMRGYLRKWLEDNGEFDMSIEFDNMLSEIKDADEKLFSMIQKFGKDIPFVFCGHVITFRNLLILAVKGLKREEMTTMGKKINESLDNGTLERLLANFSGCMSPELEAMSAVFAKLRGNSWAYKSGFLEFYSSPQDFYCPFIDDLSDIKNVIQKSACVIEVPLSLAEWQKIERSYFVPDCIIQGVNDASHYTSAVNMLINLRDTGCLLLKAPFTEKESDTIQKKLLPLLKHEHHTVEFVNFYTHLEEYYCPFMREKKSIEEAIKEAEKLSYPPIFLSEWQELESKYILPVELVRKTLSAETYHEAIDQLMEMSTAGSLVPLAADKKLAALAKACSTVSEYYNILYEVWGYKASIRKKIDEYLEKFTVQYHQLKMADNSPPPLILQEAQLKLWLDYLASLAQREFPLSEVDMSILKKPEAERTEVLAERLSAFETTELGLAMKQKFAPKVEHYRSAKNFYEQYEKEQKKKSKGRYFI